MTSRETLDGDAPAPDGEAPIVIVEPRSANLSRPNNAPSYRDPAEAYIAGLASPRSRQCAAETLRRIARAMGLDPTYQDPYCYRAVPWAQLGGAETTAALALLQRSHARSTVRLCRSILKGVLHKAFDFGLIDADRFARATHWPKLGRETRKAGRALTREEIAALRAHCAALPAFPRALTGAVVACALGGGLRRAELAFVRADALHDGLLRVVGKGNKTADQPLAGWALEAVEAWLEVRARYPFKTGALFVWCGRPHGRWLADDRPFTPWGIWNLLTSLGRDAKIPPFTPHDLRRTFITYFIPRAGVAKAQQLARHADPSTTLSYDRTPAEEAAKAMAKDIDGLGGKP